MSIPSPSLPCNCASSDLPFAIDGTRLPILAEALECCKSRCVAVAAALRRCKFLEYATLSCSSPPH
jgi:hypothetical protein